MPSDLTPEQRLRLFATAAGTLDELAPRSATPMIDKAVTGTREALESVSLPYTVETLHALLVGAYLAQQLGGETVLNVVVTACARDLLAGGAS